MQLAVRRRRISYRVIHSFESLQPRLSRHRSAEVGTPYTFADVNGFQHSHAPVPMTCGRCGAISAGDARFCADCGVPLQPREGSQRATPALRAWKEHAFGMRPWSDIAVYGGIGGVVAFVVAWVLAWLALHLLHTSLGLPLSSLARFGIPLVLGAPLDLEGHVSFLSGHAELRLPLTALVLLPVIGATTGGYLAARAFNPARGREATAIGAAAGIGFALITSVAAVAYSTNIDMPSMGFGGISIGSLSEGVRVSRPSTFIYGLIWGVPAAAFGGTVFAYGKSAIKRLPFRKQQPKSFVVAAGLETVHTLIRIMQILVVGFLAFGIIALVRSTAPLAIAPAAAAGSIFWAEGVGYQVGGSVGSIFGGGENSHHTVHFWNTHWGLVMIPIAVFLAYMLMSTGRSLARRRGVSDPVTAAVTGAAIAVPWLGLLVLIRTWASASVTAGGMGLFSGAGYVQPSLIQAVLYGAIFAGVCGAVGGIVAALSSQRVDLSLTGEERRLAFWPPFAGSAVGWEVPVAVPASFGAEPAEVPLVEIRKRIRIELTSCPACGALQNSSERCEECGETITVAPV